MRIIIGFGNQLRGEDAFGIDVLKRLENQNRKQKETKLLSLYQLTPEIVLELLEASEIVFIDATYCENNNYTLACLLEEQSSSKLSHHITYKTLIEMLNSLYDKHPTYLVYSMFTQNFECIKDKIQYDNAVDQVFRYLNT